MTQIAMKKLNAESMQEFKEFKEWKSVVNFVGSLSHPNIVRLMGYRLEDKELLLVHEFMPKLQRGLTIKPPPWVTD